MKGTIVVVGGGKGTESLAQPLIKVVAVALKDVLKFFECSHEIHGQTFKLKGAPQTPTQGTPHHRVRSF